MSLEKYSARKVSERILDLMDDLSRIRRFAEALVGESTTVEDNMAEEMAASLEKEMARFSSNCEALNNAIVTLAKNVSGLEDEEGMEVDVVQTDNGVRFT